MRNILYDSNFPFGFWLNGLFCNCCTRAAALPCTWIKERRCTRDLVVSPWPYRDLSPPTPWGHRRVLLLSFHLSLSLSLSLSLLSTHFPSLKLPPGGPRKLLRGGKGWSERKGLLTSHMMHRALRSKDYVPIRMPSWPTRGCQALPGSILRSANKV